MPKEMLTKNKYYLFSSLCGKSKDTPISLPFSYTSICEIPIFLYPKPEKGTLFGWSFPIEVMIGNPHPPLGGQLGIGYHFQRNIEYCEEV